MRKREGPGIGPSAGADALTLAAAVSRCPMIPIKALCAAATDGICSDPVGHSRSSLEGTR